MNKQIEINGLNSARIVLSNKGLTLQSLQTRVSGVYDRYNRKTQKTYHNFQSPIEFCNEMTSFLIAEYRSLKPYQKNFNNAKFRLYMLYKNPNCKIYIENKFIDMYNNH